MNRAYRDPLLRVAARLIITHNMASASFLQRKLNIGYARSAMILDQLEFLGIIGASNGAVPRKILITDLSQVENLTQPNKLSDPELQEKLLDLHIKVNKIMNALEAMSISLAEGSEEDDRDPLFDEAEKFAKEVGGKLTASDIQKKFNIGYARSARIIYELGENC